MVKVPKGYRSKNVRDLRGSSGGGRRRGGFGFPSSSSSSGGGGLGGNIGGGGGGLGGNSGGGLGGPLGGALGNATGGGRKGCGCGGIGLIILLVVLALLFFSCVGGGSDSTTTGGSSTGGSSSSGNSSTANTAPATGGELGEAEDLVNFVLDDVQEFWKVEFDRIGRTYPEAQLVLFDNNVSTGGCGSATSAVGPFYCPADSNAYIDLVFMIRLQRQLGAEGDFSQAYILAHEIGHHVQNVLGTNDAVRRAQSGASRTESNQLQVRMELQADCFAGAWARDADERGDILDSDDLQEGVRAAGAVGDDAITGSSNQENFTHGSSAQRIEWFQRGYDLGSDACDTFNGDLG